MEDLTKYKRRLRDVLIHYDVEFDTSKNPPMIHCLHPSHEDRNPSMALYDDKLVCFGCRTRMDVFDVVAHFEHVYTFPEKLSAVKRVLSMENFAAEMKSEKQSSGIQKSRSRIVETYDYTDAGGNLTFQVVRYEPKNFKQRRPDPDHPPKWVWNTKGIRKPLYHLPEVLRAKQKNRPIFIAEGERDVHTLEALGFCATCNPGGAGKWKPEYSDVLTGTQVVIVPDDDGPGRKHADAVARSLHGEAEKIKVVSLPGINGHVYKDVTEWIEAGGQKQALVDLIKKTDQWKPPQSRSVDKSGTSDGFLVIDVSRNRQQYLITNDVLDCLHQAENIFQRDGHLSRVVRVGERGLFRGEKDNPEHWPDESRRQLRAESLVIREYRSAILRDKLSERVVFKKTTEAKKERVTKCPADVIDAVLDMGEYPRVKTIVGVVETPFIRPDGSICNEPGYDRATGFFYHPSVEFQGIPDRPTEADAKKAFYDLYDPFSDFPFISEASSTVAVAQVLTLISRPMFQGNIPIFLTDAPTAGTGKTLKDEIVSLIATGRPAPLLTWPTKPDELEKILASVAMDASPLIAFDNVTGSFGGNALNKAVTSNGLVKLRILGRTETPELPWRTVIFSNGNNIQVEGDTIRRVIPCRMEPEMERPEERTDFRHPNLIEWVQENRPRLVAAALTILRSWVASGRPDMGCTRLGSFEQWSSIIPPACMFSGGADILSERNQVADSESDLRADTIALLDMLHDHFVQGETSRNIYKRSCSEPKLKDSLESLIEGDLNSRRIGKLLQRLKGKIIAGRKLTTCGKTENQQKWIVTRPNDG